MPPPDEPRYLKIPYAVQRASQMFAQSRKWALDPYPRNDVKVMELLRWQNRTSGCRRLRNQRFPKADSIPIRGFDRVDRPGWDDRYVFSSCDLLDSPLRFHGVILRFLVLFQQYACKTWGDGASESSRLARRCREVSCFTGVE